MLARVRLRGLATVVGLLPFVSVWVGGLVAFPLLVCWGIGAGSVGGLSYSAYLLGG